MTKLTGVRSFLTAALLAVLMGGVGFPATMQQRPSEVATASGRGYLASTSNSAANECTAPIQHPCEDAWNGRCQ